MNDEFTMNKSDDKQQNQLHSSSLLSLQQPICCNMLNWCCRFSTVSNWWCRCCNMFSRWLPIWDAAGDSNDSGSVCFTCYTLESQLHYAINQEIHMHKSRDSRCCIFDANRGLTTSVDNASNNKTFNNKTHLNNLSICFFQLLTLNNQQDSTTIEVSFKCINNKTFSNRTQIKDLTICFFWRKNRTLALMIKADD